MNVLIMIIYYLSVVVFHDDVTDVAIKIRKRLEVGGYNFLFAMIGLAGLILFIYYIIRRLRKSTCKKKLVFYILPTLVMIPLFYMTLLTYSIELIHYFQYAILAVLIFPLLRNYGETVFWSVIFGILDEIFQYVFLTPTFEYFDFNDMVLNLVGAGIGVILVALNEPLPFIKSKLSWHKLPSLWFILVLFFILISLYSAGMFRIYPVEPGSTSPVPWITLYRSHPPAEFWTEAYKGRYYHILGLWEGVLLMALLQFFYQTMDRKFR